MLIGYAHRLSALPGEVVEVRVSTDAPAFAAELVQVLGPAPAPDRARDTPVRPVPGTRTEGRGRLQQTRCGSYGWAPVAPLRRATLSAWTWLTAPTPGRVQGILAQRDAAAGAGVALALDEQRRPCVLAGRERIAARQPLPLRAWRRLVAELDAERGELRLDVLDADGARVDGAHGAVTPWQAAATPLLLAAAAGDAERAEGLLNGKLERPLVRDGRGDAPELHRWELGAAFDAELLRDEGPGGADLRLVNAPTRAVTGHRFSGRVLQASAAPEEYGAAHFHDDDLDDARWEVSARLRLPAELASGVYAIRLEAGEEVDHVPLCVPHDRRGGAPPRSRVAFLLPTLTHLAYANARGSTLALPADPDAPPLQRLLDAHPSWGGSLYDVHRDGSGVSLASLRRPIAGLRPEQWSRMRDEPVHYAADLAVVAWLERTGVAYDALTDHDLHAGGAEALAGYDVLVTGAHPEYCTEAMLDALAAFERAGGSLLYLGGNGFYWVTSISPSRPHLVEVRRGHSGGRAWTGEPGEGFHATTGEPGGLWRHRGRAPQRLVGVGFSAMGTAERWPGYRLLPDAADARAAFLLEGVDCDADGVLLHGAAGNELDRADAALGTPAHALRVATSEGLHDARFASGPEDVPMLLPGVGFGDRDPRVRADLVFFETGFGGAVVSVGSIAWCSRLADDGDVARVTANALRRMLAPEPFAPPPQDAAAGGEGR